MYNIFDGTVFWKNFIKVPSQKKIPQKFCTYPQEISTKKIFQPIKNFKKKNFPENNFLFFLINIPKISQKKTFVLK